MATLTKLEERWEALANRLLRLQDEVGLLRTARELNDMRSQLELELHNRSRKTGMTDKVIQTEFCLRTMEQHLRRVLLDYPSVTRWEMRDRLICAMDRAHDVLNTLEQAA